MAKQEKKRNPLLLFLFAIVIPLLIIGGLVIFVLNIAGFDIGKWAKDKDIPVVSTIVPTKEDKDIENKLVKANETIKSQREEIEELTREITSLEGIVEDLEMDITRLENRTVDTEEDKETKLNTAEDVKQAASSFRKMEPEKAASIIQSLDRNAAVEILIHLSSDVRGGILAEMEPKAAAEITKQMMNK